MNHRNLDKTVFKYLGLISIFILGIIYFEQVLLALGKLWKVSVPMILGFIIAYILNILMKKVDGLLFSKVSSKRALKFKTPINLCLSIFAIIILFLLVVNIVMPQVAESLALVAASMPEFTQRLSEYANKYQSYFPMIVDNIKQIDIDWQSISQNATTYLSKSITNFLSSSLSVVSVFVSSTVNFFMAIAFALYLIVSKDRLTEQLKRLQQAFMKKEHAEKLNTCLAVMHQCFSSFIAGQCTEAVILGTLCALGMWVLQLPYALTIGIFIGVTALIPIVGAYIGAGVGFFLIMMVSPIKAIWFIVFVMILQQLEGNVIYPKVVGTSIGLPGIWVFAAIIVGGGIGGILGMLLAVPIAATLYKLLQMEVANRLQASKEDDSNETHQRSG